MPLWTGFAQAMRDNAASTDVLSLSESYDGFYERGRKTCALTPRSHAPTPITPERLVTVFDSLYAGSTETQRQAVDTLSQSRHSAACQLQTLR
jgi:hypothetical protein